jgi:hypothetical protein
MVIGDEGSAWPSHWLTVNHIREESQGSGLNVEYQANAERFRGMREVHE